MKKFSFFLLLTLSSFLISSCQKELDPEMVDDQLEGLAERSTSFSANTTLGSVRVNPFSVTRIVAAKTALYGGSATFTPATHRYVRFKPSTQQQLMQLSHLSYPVFDFPLDREILSIGNLPYVNSEVPSGVLPYFYATVPKDTTLPSGIPVDILESLSFRMVDTAVIKKSFELAGYAASDPIFSDYKAMIREPGYIDAIKDKEDDGDDGGDGWWGDDGGSDGGGGAAQVLLKNADCGCRNNAHRRHFAGCIRVFDSQLNALVAGRRHHMIAIGPYGTWTQTNTNDGGCFHRDNIRLFGGWLAFVEMYNERTSIYAVQKQQLAGQILSSQILFPQRYSYMDFQGRDASQSTHDFLWEQDDSQVRNSIWKSITINNAVHEIHDFCNAGHWGGITPPPDHLRIMSHNFSNDGAAPMLTKIGWHYGVTPFAQMGPAVINLMVENGANLLTVPIIESIITSVAPFFQLIAPDVVIGRETQPNFATLQPTDRNRMRSNQVKELTYHELAHTIHWRNVTNNYWIDEIQYTLDNNGYGNGTAAGAGRPAVVEAWANFMGPTIANTAYGIQSSPFLLQALRVSSATESSFLIGIERFNPVLAGDPEAWIPKGIMHDLRDNTNINEPIVVSDNVSNFTIPQIFNALQNDIVDPIQYRNRLLQQNGNTQQVNVNDLFSDYGF